MPKTQNRLSTDDLLIPVTLVVQEGANPDPTTDPVYFAFTPGRLPPRMQPSTWYAGYWLQEGTQLLVAILVGPEGGVTLGVGPWTVWVKVSDDPTAPVKAVDWLKID